MAQGTAEVGVGPGPGSEPAHTVVDSLRRLTPINEAVLFFEQRSERSAGVVLRHWHERSIAESAQRVDNEGCAELGEAFGELRCRFVRCDSSLALEDNIAGVHTGVDA